jgi:hypothetical protein
MKGYNSLGSVEAQNEVNWQSVMLGNSTTSISAIMYDPPLAWRPAPDNGLTAYIEPIDYGTWEKQPLPTRAQAYDPKPLEMIQ